ncbi:hypothetical protein HUS23_13820 [Ectothiorhodospiraceae bacterium 2226]|nr:hypothetical protein HUS23_13820 [Ectothiorhodospiraceae bacterium 2226]
MDATVTLVVRLRHGTRWSEPHRRHVYQRVARRWGSHGRVTTLYTIINMVWLLPWALLAWTQPAWGAPAALAALAPLAWWVWREGAGRPVDETPGVSGP